MSDLICFHFKTPAVVPAVLVNPAQQAPCLLLSLSPTSNVYKLKVKNNPGDHNGDNLLHVLKSKNNCAIEPSMSDTFAHSVELTRCFDKLHLFDRRRWVRKRLFHFGFPRALHLLLHKYTRVLLIKHCHLHIFSSCATTAQQ